jgi:hypothetical protein
VVLLKLGEGGGEWGWVWRGPGEGLSLYRGRREAKGRLQWSAMKALVTRYEKGGFTTE